MNIVIIIIRDEYSCNRLINKLAIDFLIEKITKIMFNNSRSKLFF